MSIQYENSGYTLSNRRNGQLSEALVQYGQLYEQMRNSEFNLLSEDIVHVMQNPTAFAELSAALTEGLEAETAEQLTTVLNSSREVMLQESFISGISPVTALSVPMLRVGFPKLAVREGLPTEPVEQPKFRVTTKRPYVIDQKTNERIPLQQALRQRGELFALPQLETSDISAVAGVIKAYDLLAPISKDSKLGDEIDPDFCVVEVTVGGNAIPCEIRLDTTHNVLSGSVKKSDGTVVQLLGSVDRAKGLFSLTDVGAGVVEKVKVRGYVSSEANNASTVVNFGIDGEDLVVGTGQPIESPVSIQSMMDVMNTYQIDSTMVHLETMSTALAHTIDLKGVKFIMESFQKDPSVKETFDVKAPANYNMGDTMWREEIKRHIDRLVTKLQERANIYSGRTVIFAHPLDAQVISNVRWTFDNNDQPNAVAVDYKVANYSSSISSYTLLQSPHFPQGKMYLLYIPAEADFRTSVYFPYSFNTIRGGASPHMP